MRTSELDYHLPPGRIATHPASPRDAARLLVVDRSADRVAHHHVRDLPDLGVLHGGDVMVFNDSKVIPARFSALRLATGGRVHGLYLAWPEALRPDHWLVLLESRGTLRPGERLGLDDQSHLELLERRDAGQWLARLHSPLDTLALLERIGTTPLPPYIRQERKAHHEPEVADDDARLYNTVYAQNPGSVAAPTAGLHFTPELLARLDALGVVRVHLSLHVGLGTFAPVRTETLENHPMHAEWIRVPRDVIQALRRARSSGRRIIPVGTTSVRALESLPDPPPESFTGATSLFIHPGFPFRFADAMMTNFHLPRSTLLALVAALPGVGLERLKRWYQIAIDEGYRFYSYGDAMLLV